MHEHHHVPQTSQLPAALRVENLRRVDVQPVRVVYHEDGGELALPRRLEALHPDRLASALELIGDGVLLDLDRFIGSRNAEPGPAREHGGAAANAQAPAA